MIKRTYWVSLSLFFCCFDLVFCFLFCFCLGVFLSCVLLDPGLNFYTRSLFGVVMLVAVFAAPFPDVVRDVVVIPTGLPNREEGMRLRIHQSKHILDLRGLVGSLKTIGVGRLVSLIGRSVWRFESMV